MSENTSDKKRAKLTADRDRKRYRRSVTTTPSFEAALFDVATTDGTAVPVHDCGKLCITCRHCAAIFFCDERRAGSSAANPKFHLCCCDGKIALSTLQTPPQPLASLLTENGSRCRDFRRNIRRYNCALCLATMQADEVTFSYDQRRIYRSICDAVDSSIGGVYFLDAPGGTGKTFVMNCLLAYVMQNNDIALAVASSGIAATLLKLGRTAHSRFKLPIPCDEASTCNITPRSATAELIRRTKLIVWDEAPMSHRYLFDAVNRTLCDIMKNDKPFGGIVTLLAGDFRQILPVVRMGRRPDIVDAALSRSALWQQVVLLRLHRNMRVEKYGRDAVTTARGMAVATWRWQTATY